MKKVVALVLVAVLITAFLAACSPKSDRELIEDKINKYFSCINNLDYNGSLDCMDQKTRAAMESMMNLLGNLVGTDLNDLLNIGALFGSSDYMNVSVVSFDDVDISGDSATVKVTISATVNGTTETNQMTVPMVKENGDWFITANLGGLGSLY